MRAICLPAADKHFYMFSWYQRDVYKLARKHVQNFRTAVDVGAHVGYFSIYMARDFNKVVAFEPIAENAYCWSKNLAEAANATLFQCALGDRTDPIYMTQACDINSGSWEVTKSSSLLVEQNKLDSFGLQDVDYIKLDVQDYEPEVLFGAIETIYKYKPVVQIEMSTRQCIQRAGTLMCKLGYEPVEQQKDDVIWRFVDVYDKDYGINLFLGDNNHVMPIVG